MYSQLLDLSTGHLPHEEFLRLDNKYDNPPMRVLHHEYGILLFCTEVDDEEEYWVDSPVLKHIMRLAYDHGAIAVNFDQDGQVHEELVLYDW